MGLAAMENEVAPAMNSVARICLIGAESTGKTTLAQALAESLKCPWVPEYLREFCIEHQRPPRLDEQRGILLEQKLREENALVVAQSSGARYLICDTAPLLTAVYSEYVFADSSLFPDAIKLHRDYSLTLLLAPDLAWEADGIQRDGAHVRAPVTAMIQDQLARHQLPWEWVRGFGEARVATARYAIDALATFRKEP